MPETQAFYQATSAVCFVLLGLWWAAVTNLNRQLLRTRRNRRVAASVQYWFLIPGLMSLAATLTPGSKVLWRGVFVTLACFGVAVTVGSIIRAPGFARDGLLLRYSRPLVVAAYAAVAAVAIRPRLVADVGIDSLQPLQIEGLLLCALVFLTTGLAWDLMLDGIANVPVTSDLADRQVA